jgi:hypothetical protein
MAHPGGRPTKYRKEYCDEIIRFFDIPFTETVKKTVITKSGVQYVTEEVPKLLPTVEGFAIKIGVLAETLRGWAERYPQFSVSYKRALQLEKQFLIQNGLKGFYPPNIFTFIATNLTDMKDKSTKEHTGVDGGPISTKITVEFVDAPKRGDDDSPNT